MKLIDDLTGKAEYVRNAEQMANMRMKLLHLNFEYKDTFLES